MAQQDPGPAMASGEKQIPPAIAALRPGGRYRLTKFIGSGSFGEIFVGVNIQTGEEVAVKLVWYRVAMTDRVGKCESQTSTATI